MKVMRCLQKLTQSQEMFKEKAGQLKQRLQFSRGKRFMFNLGRV